jgi:hypothetical protein
VTAVRGSIWFTNSDGNQRLHLFSYNLNGKSHRGDSGSAAGSNGGHLLLGSTSFVNSTAYNDCSSRFFSNGCCRDTSRIRSSSLSSSVLVAALRSLQRC